MQQRHLGGIALIAALALAGCQTGTRHDTSTAQSDASADGIRPDPKSTTRQARVVFDAASPNDGYAPPAPPAPPATPFPAAAHPAAHAHAAEATRALAVAPGHVVRYPPMRPPANTERYDERSDNPVQRTSENPVSTFSIDVDTGSYANVRRMLNQGQRPPSDAVRVEEFINYFSYGHPAPTSLDTPFQVTTEVAPAPWNGDRHLLMIGIKGYDVEKTVLPPSNLVFLVDTSGSMYSQDKLPLLQQAFTELVGQLRAEDSVSIVAYAGSAGLVLPPTAGDRKGEIIAALNRLRAGGSTNGGDGLRLAYAMARQAFVPDGVNRVVLATDGDFNVGVVGINALETLVADQRASGIALTTLGFGQGNYNDALAERLAAVGNGNHAYIDTLREARKVLVDEMQSTLLTIANDVKIQIEFNPAQVSEYRLIGYENRLLNHEDFNNDKVDAGDIGAGHEVTALYEIALSGSPGERLPPLRYGRPTPSAAGSGSELANLQLRYKRPGEDRSRLIATPVLRSQIQDRPSEALRFASGVAAFADALRGGTHIDGWSWDEIEQHARAALGDDRWQFRSEFLGLVASARHVTDRQHPQQSGHQVGYLND